MRSERRVKFALFESGLQPFQHLCEGNPLIRPYRPSQRAPVGEVSEQRRDSGWRRCDEGDRDLLAHSAWTDGWGSVEHLDDLRRLDGQMRVSKQRIAEAVTASGTSLTEVFGVGPVVAATVIGYTGDVARFRNRDHFAATPAPLPSRCLRRARYPPAVATRQPPAQPRPPHRRDHPDPLPALPGPSVFRAQGRRRQDQERSRPRPQAPHRRRCLPTAAHRRLHGARAREGNGERL
jgi:hypothetical protein